MPRGRGCLVNSLLFLVCVFIPLLGHIIETVFILDDDHTPGMKVFWLLVVWLIPFVGPFLYLLLGQKAPRYGRVMFGQSAYYPPQSQNVYQQQQRPY